MNIWEIGLGDKAQYDGILTSGELGNLNLSKTRLVTLSACSSGRGYLYSWTGCLWYEAVLSLSWS